MNEYHLERANRLRRWARLLREKADDPNAYQKSLLHTIETRPGQPPQERYCAAGLMEIAAYPEGTPHAEIWEQTDSEGDHIAIYSPKGNGSETSSNMETLDSLGLWPECNPFAMRELEQGEENADPALQQFSSPDLVFIPLDRIPDPTRILERDTGLADLDDNIYVYLGAVSDAGQQHWLDIAAFAEHRAGEIEAEARQPG